jgi:hypothetical protein
MSEDCHYSGDPNDEPLFAQKIQRGPGATIYTCPKCGGPREDGMRCVRCVYRSTGVNAAGVEISTHSALEARHAYLRPGYDPANCPCCNYGATYGSAGQAEACMRCGLPRAEFESFREPRTLTAFDHALLNGMKIKWEGDDRK